VVAPALFQDEVTMTMNHGLRALTVAALVAASGCYSYQTVGIDEVRPGRDVRVRVTGEEGARVSGVVGYTTRDVEGKVIELDSDALLLTVPAQTAVEGSSLRRFYQRIDVPRSAVIEIEARRLNATKTFLAAGGAALAGTAVVIAAFTDLVRGSEEGDKGGTEHMIPLLRIR
jgi:hypothetical protein